MPTRSTRSTTKGLLLLALTLTALHPVYAQQRTSVKVSGSTPATSPVDVSRQPLSASARGELVRQFVTKWGNYVARVYAVPPRTWAMRMVPSFVEADPANFRNALERDTFEGAMLALSGAGHQYSDSQIIDSLAMASMDASPDAMRTAGAKALGSLSQDLVYTPIQPCRIVDTRVVGGAIAANGTRSFLGIAASNYTNQGGSSTNCGTAGLNAAALALNVTAVVPGMAGYATVFPYGTTQPLAASVNYTAGAVVNNGIIAQIPNPIAVYDFTIYSFAQSHYVVDIVGYFAPPVATALDCIHTFTTGTVAANATFDRQIPACPAGYSLVGAGCRTPGFGDADWAINGLFRQNSTTLGAYCSGRNKSASSITVEGVGQCCRVPGR